MLALVFCQSMRCTETFFDVVEGGPGTAEHSPCIYPKSNWINVLLHNKNQLPFCNFFASWHGLYWVKKETITMTIYLKCMFDFTLLRRFVTFHFIAKLLKTPKILLAIKGKGSHGRQNVTSHGVSCKGYITIQENIDVAVLEKK